MSEPTPVNTPEKGLKTSSIISSVDHQDTVQLETENADCYWNDQVFSKGDNVNHDGKCYECSFGIWTQID